MKKILILVNHDIVIYNFRKELVQKLVNNGFKVYIASPYGKKIDKLIEIGCEYFETNINRHGTNILEDIKLLITYKKLINKIKPNVVLSYTIKPNIYGGIICKLLGVPFIATITGLGTALERDNFMQKLLLMFYKYAFSKVNVVFFQNKSNMDFFKIHKIALGKHRLVNGSGVNLEEFSFQEYPKENDKINILFIGRIMKEKGIEELTEAAKIIKSYNKKIIFKAVGFIEENYEKKAKELEKLNIIKFYGHQEEVKSFIKEAHVIILPSYHEGMANVLLEASSMGRPVIASMIPGCQEIFDEGISGIGIEPKNVKSIVTAINNFINLPYEKKKNMGYQARKKVEKEFDRNKVINAYLDEIKKIYKNIN